MIESVLDGGKRHDTATRDDSRRKTIAVRNTKKDRLPFRLSRRILIAIILGGFGFFDLSLYGGPLISSPQSESHEDKYTPIGVVPEWTNATESDDPATTRIVVFSGLLHDERKANEELWSNAIAAVARKLDQKIARGAGKLVRVDRDLITRKLLVPGRVHTQVYQTPVPVSIEPAVDGVDDKPEYLDWHRCFVELEFNDGFYEWATLEYEHRLVENRVQQTALFVLSGFSLLVVLFGFLKFNHRTQGMYTGRLQSIAIVAAVAVILVALALSNSIAWL